VYFVVERSLVLHRISPSHPTSDIGNSSGISTWYDSSCILFDHAMSVLLKPFTWFYHAFGLVSIQDTGPNAYLIILARACRMFAYGTNSLILGMAQHRHS